MKLASLLSDYPLLQVSGEVPNQISGFSADSNKIRPGYLYVCIRGEKNDGHRYAEDAIRKGAQIIVAEQPLMTSVPVILVSSTRDFLSFIADRFYGRPSRRLNIAGITGTNGKTTTAHYLYQIYREAGIQAAMMGTAGVKTGDYYARQSLTTPGAEELHKTLWQLAGSGVCAVAMEVSSHALVQKRVEHCSFDTAVFTNLSREHLDYHGTMEQYFQAKCHLFYLLKNTENARSVINIDDKRAERLKQMAPGTVWTYGIQKDADVRALDIQRLYGGGSLVRTQTPFGSLSLVIRLHGLYNVYNALAAAAAALAEGISPADVVAGVESLQHVPGRLELLPSPPGIRVYLDYAHTPDGLGKVLQAVNEYPHNKIILVFGCRGSRDMGKRPQMGQIAEMFADKIILTSDNPAEEDPYTIAQDIASLMKKKVVIFTDREQAVHYALRIAREGDIVLITGKGREDYQLVGENTLPYSDMQAVASYLGESAKLQ
ncbi:MAG: UDP-N-acetylmuramoyl-L-alanyl-D-glutamate--2,6-diaminopimelate ligase [Bacillota bacterium]|nr:UDP-N-acetylmuramoyl-L-alanyl-D-glutamate--2,6-diaminopimelate ligase [Bacillota bacterium]MDW7685067.1 UDP-N-acetylmuramoyl-L-alanyl-D-glutamate--2,6-diaminopimelate ligase [Bacillota bacterium]